MSDDKKQVCGRHFVSGQGIVTICGDAPAPAGGEALAELNRLTFEGIVLVNGQTLPNGKTLATFKDWEDYVAKILARHGTATEARVRAEVVEQTLDAIHKSCGVSIYQRMSAEVNKQPRDGLSAMEAANIAKDFIRAAVRNARANLTSLDKPE